jgi:hypothetical protein
MSLVIKLRDEILITSANQNNIIFDIPEGYYAEAEIWHNRIFYNAEIKSDYIDCNSALQFIKGNIDNPLIEVLKNHAENFLNVLIKNNLQLSFLFKNNKISSFNDFEDQFTKGIKDEKYQLKTYSDGCLNSPKTKQIEGIPNFYNYFTLSIDNKSETDNKLLKLLSPFLPHKNCYTSHLLEFAYIRPEIIESGGDKPLYDLLDANQDFYSDMNIPIDDNEDIQGRNIKISIVEMWRWNIQNTEFSINNSDFSLIYPKTVQPDLYLNSTDFSEHGNGALGILKSERIGSLDRCLGITPKAQIQLASCDIELREDIIVEDLIATENTLWSAISNSGFGDVVLIEIQNSDYSPLEYQPVIYQLIQYATRRSIIIVEPAGNYGKKIDNLNSFKSLNSIGSDAKIIWENYKRFISRHGQPIIFSENNFKSYLSRNPSGAILVGAYAKFSEPPYFRRVEQSNWGKNVEIFAQGENILTVSKTQYQSFSSTSGASAIIAGVVASLQSFAKSYGYYFDSYGFLSFFRENISSEVFGFNNKTQKVGISPNYGEIREKIQVLLESL